MSLVWQRFPCGRAAFESVVVQCLLGHAYAQTSHRATRRWGTSIARQEPNTLLFQKRLHPVKRASHKHDRKTAWETTVLPARAQRKRTWMAILFCKAQKTTCHACGELRTGVQKKIEVLYVDDACFFWAARWLAVLSMQDDSSRSPAHCPLSGSASPADALLQVGGCAVPDRACIRTVFAPGHPALG